MKKILIALTFLGLIANPIFAADNVEKAVKPLPSLEEIVKGLKPVVAKVDGEEIKKEEMAAVLKEIYPKIKVNAEKGNQIDIDVLLKNLLNNMVMDKLLFKEVAEKRIEVDEKEMKSSLEMIYQRFQGKENFEKFLKQQKLNEKEFKRKFIADLKVQKLMKNEIFSKLKVEDKEAKEFYDKNPDMFKMSGKIKASHILVKYKKSEGEEKKKAALKKINDIKKKVNKGDDFAELAKKHSEGPSSKSGGDLGFFQKGQMVPSFEEAAFKLKKGEVSDVVESPFGFHIIKLIDTQEPATVKFEDVKPQLQQRLKAIKAQVEEKKFFDDLMKKYNVETFI